MANVMTKQQAWEKVIGGKQMRQKARVERDAAQELLTNPQASQKKKRVSIPTPPGVPPAGRALQGRKSLGAPIPIELVRSGRAGNMRGKFGKALRPYRRHLRKVTPKGIWFNTRFGVKKLRVNRVGMYIKASRKNFYLHKW